MERLPAVLQLLEEALFIWPILNVPRLSSVRLCAVLLAEAPAQPRRLLSGFAVCNAQAMFCIDRVLRHKAKINKMIYFGPNEASSR